MQTSPETVLLKMDVMANERRRLFLKRKWCDRPGGFKNEAVATRFYYIVPNLLTQSIFKKSAGRPDAI